jgi:hypothetical protein
MKLWKFEKNLDERGEFYACLELIRVGNKNLLMFFFDRENPKDRSYVISGGGVNLWVKILSKVSLLDIELKLGHIQVSVGLLNSNFVGCNPNNPCELSRG